MRRRWLKLRPAPKPPLVRYTGFSPRKRFWPGRWSSGYAVLIDEAFDAIDRKVNDEPLEVIADDILDLMINLPGETKAIFAILETRSEWSSKLVEFRDLVLKRIARILLLSAPALPKRDAKNAAEILLHNVKTMKAMKFGQHPAASPGAANELRHMNRLYLASKLAKR